MKDKKTSGKNFISATDYEKELLKNKITASIYLYRRRKKQLQYGVGLAASIAIVVCIGFYRYDGTSSINNYVKAANNVSNEGHENVKLILNDQKSIDILEDNSTITYSSTGQQIKIGTTKDVSQLANSNDKIAYNTIVVPYGKRSKLELSDGSMVWLNSGSKLVYPVIFDGKKREVYLEGEGIFEVTHNKEHPFIVMAENHEIEVLGTVFNVSNYADENLIRTTLKSGSVQINYKGDSFLKLNESVRIKPGTMVSYDKDKNQIRTKKVNVDNYFSWREGIFIFKSDNLKYIMKRLSRYYNIDIVIKNEELANQAFSGYLDLKENVEDVVKTIKETSDFEFSNNINDNKIIIN